MDDYFFGGRIFGNDFKVKIPSKNIGDRVMILYLDVLGKEKKEVKAASEF